MAASARRRKCKRSVGVSPLRWSSWSTGFRDDLDRQAHQRRAGGALPARGRRRSSRSSTTPPAASCRDAGPGPGAEALGLRGEVTDTDFAAVLSGTHPRTGEDLGKHWRTQTVVAFDVAVSAPKDVSILYALGDEHTRATILRIHGEGVHAAAEYLQANAGWARQFNAETKSDGGGARQAGHARVRAPHRAACDRSEHRHGHGRPAAAHPPHRAQPGCSGPTGAGASCTASPCTSTRPRPARSHRRSGATAWCASWASPRWSTARGASPSSASRMRSDASSRGGHPADRRRGERDGHRLTRRTRGGHARHPREQARGRGHRGSLRPDGGSVPRASGSTATSMQACSGTRARGARSRAGSTCSDRVEHPRRARAHRAIGDLHPPRPHPRRGRARAPGHEPGPARGDGRLDPRRP